MGAAGFRMLAAERALVFPEVVYRGMSKSDVGGSLDLNYLN